MFVMPLFTTQKWTRIAAAICAGVLLVVVTTVGEANPVFWKLEWSKTDFSKSNVPLDEIISGGVPKDGIPPIDNPRFTSIAEVERLYKGTEPVVSLSINGEAKAYPLSILMTHEIVNDEIGGKPVSVTFCPLCNSAIVFDRNINGKIYDFGVSGKLRFSDLVMWDRQTESWWQQFTGEAIVGEMTGTLLTMLPVRVESFDKYKERFPDGQVLLSPRGGPGFNPYAGYDSAPQPFLYRGAFPDCIRPLDNVLPVGDEAWSIELLKRERRIEKGDLVITWEPGQNAAMNTRNISDGRDIGNVVVQRKQGDALVDVVHDVTFAFAFHAFNPKGVINK